MLKAVLAVVRMLVKACLLTTQLLVVFVVVVSRRSLFVRSFVVSEVLLARVLLGRLLKIVRLARPVYPLSEAFFLVHFAQIVPRERLVEANPRHM